MNRRGLLGGILASLAAPAIVKAEIIMPVRRPVIDLGGPVDFPANFWEPSSLDLTPLEADQWYLIGSYCRAENGVIVVRKHTIEVWT